MSEYVSSNIFIGRTEELDTVHTFIQSENNSRLLCIHSNGGGGFGKTQLLLRVRDDYRKEEENIVVGQQLLDFYHLDMQRKVGVLESLAEQLDLTEPLSLITASRQKSNFPEHKDNIEHFFEEFSAKYHEHISKKKKKFIFFFDSYEHIQRVTDRGECSTSHSHWLETKLIPLLVNECNVRVILAGRYLPAELNIPFDSLELSPFSQTTSIEFLSRILEEEGGIAFEDMQELYRLTDGHPIRLALAVDWLKHSYDPVQKLLDGITPGKAFEGRLIKYIRHQLEEDERFFISSYITIAYQRLNADILHHLTGEKKEDCEKYIEQMQTWSFIKPKGKDSVILHDVMHFLFDQYIKSEDPEFYRNNLELLIKYYQNILFGEEQSVSDAEQQEQYILEMVDYSFQLNFDQGVERFCIIFDQVMENGQYHFASNFLLKAAEDLQFRYQGQSNTLNFLKIEARRIEYETESYANHQGALERADKIIEEYKNDPRWKDQEIEGIILLKKGMALFGLARFNEAITTFTKATTILKKNNAALDKFWADNWTGYNYYQLGNFAKAEHLLGKNRKRFHEEAEGLLRETEKWDEAKKNNYRKIMQGYQITLVNLALVYFSTGRLYEAVRHARVFLHIAQNLQRNDREIARAQATLAIVSWYMGYRLETRKYLENSLERVENDPLLVGRIKTEQLRQEFHESGLLYAFFLEYYRAKEFKGKLEEHKEEILLTLSSQEQVDNVIQDLERLGTTKELLTAYMVQADICLLKVPDISFKKIEEILRKGLQEDAQEDLQRYEKARALESLVRLCYLAKAWDTPEAQEVAGQFNSYKKDFEEFIESLKQENISYPEVFSRYQIVLGNEAFDEAIQKLNLEDLKRAVEFYLKSAELLEEFGLFRHHPYRIIRHRLVVFIQKCIEAKKTELLDSYSETIKGLQNGSYSKASKNYFLLVVESTELCLPSASKKDLNKYTILFFDDEKYISIEKKVIKAKSITDALRSLIIKTHEDFHPDQQSELQELRFKRAMWLMQSACYYKKMWAGNIQFVLRAYDKAEKEVRALEEKLGSNSVEILSLKERLATGRGTVYYRHGSYTKFYLQDERDEIREAFIKNFEEGFRKAECLLLEGKEYAEQVEKKKTDEVMPRADDDLSRINAQWLGAAYYRLGEFKCLCGEFEEALDYLRKTITVCESYCASYAAPEDIPNDIVYRKLDAMASYVTTVYFQKKYHQQLIEADDLCGQFIKKVEEKGKEHPAVLAKLKVTQGDDIFTRLFDQDEQRSKVKGYYRDIRYSLREEYKKRIQLNKYKLPHDVEKMLRQMVTYYVDACSLMKQADSPGDFTVTVRVTIRRIRMLMDAPVIEKLHRVLKEEWDDHPILYHECQRELKTISEFASILEGLIKEIPNSRQIIQE
ncbi:MAG: hypothetical protein SD837_06650 [Candidatus Electrothrix scaldis]|nr:MAG: hypothetical protein SD837_06650 [Candidatus Electrothrix sp. GW3-3]